MFFNVCTQIMSASSATVEQLMEHLLLDSRFKKQYLSCKSDWDRMEVLLSEAICVSTLNEFGTKLNDGTLEGWHKSSKNVTKLRLEGNAQFAAKKYAAACASYSRALLFSESRDYSVLFANRSAALFHLGEYQVSGLSIECVIVTVWHHAILSFYNSFNKWMRKLKDRRYCFFFMRLSMYVNSPLFNLSKVVKCYAVHLLNVSFGIIEKTYCMQKISKLLFTLFSFQHWSDF